MIDKRRIKIGIREEAQDREKKCYDIICFAATKAEFEMLYICTNHIIRIRFELKTVDYMRGIKYKNQIKNLSIVHNINETKILSNCK